MFMLTAVLEVQRMPPVGLFAMLSILSVLLILLMSSSHQQYGQHSCKVQPTASCALAPFPLILLSWIFFSQQGQAALQHECSATIVLTCTIG